MAEDQVVPQGPGNLTVDDIISEMLSARERVNDLMRGVKRQSQELLNVESPIAFQVDHLEDTVYEFSRFKSKVEKSLEDKLERDGCNFPTIPTAQIHDLRRFIESLQEVETKGDDSLEKSRKILRAVQDILDKMVKNRDMKDDDETQFGDTSESEDEEEDEPEAYPRFKYILSRALREAMEKLNGRLRRLISEWRKPYVALQRTGKEIRTANDKAEQGIRTIEELIETSLKQKVEEIEERLVSEAAVDSPRSLREERWHLKALASEEEFRCTKDREVISRFQSYSVDIQRIIDEFCLLEEEEEPTDSRIQTFLQE